MAEDRTPRTVSPSGEPEDDNMRPSPKQKDKARRRETRRDDLASADRRRSRKEHTEDRFGSRII